MDNTEGQFENPLRITARRKKQPPLAQGCKISLLPYPSNKVYFSSITLNFQHTLPFIPTDISFPSHLFSGRSHHYFEGMQKSGTVLFHDKFTYGIYILPDTLSCAFDISIKEGGRKLQLLGGS